MTKIPASTDTNTDTNIEQASPERPEWRARPLSRRSHLKGQSLLIVALCLTVLILFVGLSVDVGNLMARRAKLQSAVDASALSAAQMLSGGTNMTQTASIKAYQMLETNGVLSNTLNTAQTQVTFIGGSVVTVHAVQRIDTFFMRIVPTWSTMEISSEATADLNAYAEINTKPFGKPGVVSELNLQVWGSEGWRRGGDAYSPTHIDATTLNPLHDEQPYGYLYRIDVPASYTSDYLNVEIFDPDSYNKPGPPPTFPVSPTPTPPPGPGTPTATPRPPTPTPITTADMYASCTNPRVGECTSNGSNDNPALKLNGFPTGRTAFWRVDEYRSSWNSGCEICGIYDDQYATTSQYTLWHFNPRINSAFGDPSQLSDQASYLARYTIKTDQTVPTDLSWYRPPGFQIQLKNVDGTDRFDREATGGMYFYMYVQGIAGSSENNFDLRVGPPQATYNCSTPCYVNQQYFTGVADWVDGGARIFAKRALPLNLDTGTDFPLLFTQVSKNAAGQVLGIRHFDQDCDSNGNCTGGGSTMNYQMQKCGCTNLNDPSCWQNVATGYRGTNNGWSYGTNPDPERVPIPFEGTSDYNTFFGSSGQCQTSWLRIESNPSYSNDTTVWEMPYIRPRLIK